MTKQGSYFIYLLERYAEAKQAKANEILQLWDSLDLTEFIYGMYEMYHVERVENAIRDIDDLIAEKCPTSCTRNGLERN